MSTQFKLQYTKTNDNTGNTELEVEINFENADYNKLRDNLNTWLQAIGMSLVVQHRQSQISGVVPHAEVNRSVGKDRVEESLGQFAKEIKGQ